MTKIGKDFQNFKARRSLFIQKVADRSAPLHWYSKEFQTIVISLIVVRMVTALFSISTGYFAVLQFVKSFLDIAILATFLTVGFLVGLEYLSNDFAFRVSKYQVKREKRLMLIFLPFALLFVSLSGFLSYNGIKQITKQGTIKRAAVELKMQKEIDSLNRQRANQIAYYQDLINTIKANPRGWKNGKPTQLTLAQQKQINLYSAKIDSISAYYENLITQTRNRYAKQKLEVTQLASEKGYRYGWFIIGIQVFNLIITWLLVYLLDKVYLQNNKKSYRSEVLTSIKTQAAAQYNRSYVKAVQTFTDNVITEFDYANYNVGTDELNPAEIDKVTIENANNTTARTAANDDAVTSANGSSQNTSEPPARAEEAGEKRVHAKDNVTTSEKNIRFVHLPHEILVIREDDNLSPEQRRFMRKHKNLIRAILRNKDLSTDDVSNAEIKAIQRNCTHCTHKSASTIRKVWTAMQAAGINNVKKFLNIKNGQKIAHDTGDQID